MIRNPFTFGNPIREPERFIGRDRAIQQIVSRLLSSAHESTSVVGERRIGKTSLLKHLSNPDVAEQYGLAKDEFCLVYIDFQGLTDITPKRFWQRVLRLLGRNLRDSDLYADIEALRNKDEIDLFDLEDLFYLFDDEGINIVLLMDEFEFVTQNPNFGSDFFGGLRALAIHCNLSLIPATRRELVDLCHSEEIKGSPFFNIFATVVLRPFTIEQASELLVRYTADSSFNFTAEEVSFIINLVGGYPIFTQIGGFYMFDGKQQGLIGKELFDYVIESFSEQADQHFTYYWSHSTDSEKITLISALALRMQKKADPTEEKIKSMNTRASLDINELVKRGMMVRQGDNVHVFSPVFEQWITLEVSAIPGEEESATTVEAWMKDGGDEKLEPVKGILPRFKKKYWKSVGNVLKEVSFELISRVTVDMITGQF